jgi:PAS domain S-box-containing protein
MLGYRPDALVGTNVGGLIHPEEVPRALECLDRGDQQSGRDQFVQFRARHKDGSWRLM